MDLSNIGNVHQLINTYGCTPKKSLSQNFLIDQNVLNKIIKVSQLEEGDFIIEIGPGLGALTQALLEKGAFVFAIETDKRFIPNLMEIEKKYPRFSYHHGDFLKFPLEKKLASWLKNGKKAKVIANLPYHITTPIISSLICMHKYISTLTVMVQDDLARRFTAKKNEKNYSSLTLFLNYHCHITHAGIVKPSCFYPKPKVNSAIAHFTIKQHTPLPNEDEIFKLIQTAFGQRRKMLTTSLSHLYPKEKLTCALKALNLNTKARPQELDMQDFINLYRQLSSKDDTI